MFFSRLFSCWLFLILFIFCYRFFEIPKGKRREKFEPRKTLPISTMHAIHKTLNNKITISGKSRQNFSMVVFSFFSAFFCFFVDIQSFLWLFSCNESFSRKSHCILYLNWFKIVHRRKIAVQHNKQKMKNNLKFSPSPLFCNRFEFKS